MPVQFAQNHPGLVVAALSFVIMLLGAVVGLLIKIIWKIISDLKETMDRWYQDHLQCRERQEREYLKIKAFEDWQVGRTGKYGIFDQINSIWEAINRHSHSEKGKVER